MLDDIRKLLAGFTKAERRIAEAILATPSTAITWSIADAAHVAEVSEPSITRFCRRLDCDGFPDFRLKLAQYLAVAQSPAIEHYRGDDPSQEIAADIFARAEAALRDTHRDLDMPVLARAVELLAMARRVDIYGYGGSGLLGSEAQQRLASLGIASAAYSDPTLQMFSAPRLTAKDAVFALSFTGQTSYLVANLEIARKAGARILTMAPSNSIVAHLGEINVAMNAYRRSDDILSVPTGRAPMYVLIDVISALLVRRMGGGSG